MPTDISCDLFIRDDELDEMDWKYGNKEVKKNLEFDRNNYEDMIGYMREVWQGIWQGE